MIYYIVNDLGIYKKVSYNWLNVNDLESAIEELDRLQIHSLNFLRKNYPGLESRLKKLNLLKSIYSISEFDSSWEKLYLIMLLIILVF